MSNLSLKDRIQEDMKKAMRAKDQLHLGTIRLLLSAIKQREVDERITLDDAAIIDVINKMIKQRKESIKQYEAGSRQDLADQEKKEIEYISVYLPEQMSETEIDTLISATIASTGASSIKDMGKVMAQLKAQIAGRADMAVVSNKIKQKLS